MLITRNILNKALEDKVPLFHDGDYIDDDVLYDLFYAPRVLGISHNGRKNWMSVISKDDRKILCAELKGFKNIYNEFDKIYCVLKCKSCSEDFIFYITKSQIIHKTLKYQLYKKTSDYKSYIPSKISNNCDIHRCFLLDAALNKRFHIMFGNAHNLYVCSSCRGKFDSDSMQEVSDFLDWEDKFDWYHSNESVNDWRRELFYVTGLLHNSKGECIGQEITAADGSVWTDEEYAKWKRSLEEAQKREEEEQKHQEKLEEIRRQQKLDEETEREKTRKENELFLARHQSNTPTQSYINKFCRKDSDIDITDKENQREALSPEGVNYEVIQKHNSKLYREYLQSPLWKIISSKVKWNAHNCCERCGSKLNLEVHHTSYEFKGVEFLAFQTLECLCSKCHKEKHRK